MATTYLYRGLDQPKGPYAGNPIATPLHIGRGSVNVSGTYVTGGANVDLCSFYANAHEGVSAINVLWVKAFGDYFDGSNTYDVDNASIALTSGGAVTAISAASTNNLVLVKLFSGTNGSGGSEIANSTAVAGDFGLIWAVQLTFGAVGVM